MSCRSIGRDADASAASTNTSPQPEVREIRCSRAEAALSRTSLVNQPYLTPSYATVTVWSPQQRGVPEHTPQLGAHVDEPERTRHAWWWWRVVAGTVAVVRRVAPSATVVPSPVIVMVSPAAILRPGHPSAHRRGRSGARDSRADSQGSCPESSNNHCTRRKLLHCNHLNLNPQLAQRHHATR